MADGYTSRRRGRSGNGATDNEYPVGTDINKVAEQRMGAQTGQRGMAQVPPVTPHLANNVSGNMPEEKTPNRPMRVMLKKMPQDENGSGINMEKETEESPMRETENCKYLDTMWLWDETMSYQNGTEYYTFDVIVYPLTVRPDGYPVPIIAAIRREGVVKPAMSGDRYTVEIVFEGLVVRCTGVFRCGKFEALISVSQPGIFKGKVASLKQQAISGSYIPYSFGKRLVVGPGSAEIFPVSLENDPSTGCVPFLWIHKKPDTEEIHFGPSDQEQKVVLDFIESGQIQTKTVYVYWDMDETGKTKLNIATGL